MKYNHNDYDNILIRISEKTVLNKIHCQKISKLYYIL